MAPAPALLHPVEGSHMLSVVELRTLRGVSKEIDRGIMCIRQTPLPSSLQSLVDAGYLRVNPQQGPTGRATRYVSLTLTTRADTALMLPE